MRMPVLHIRRVTYALLLACLALGLAALPFNVRFALLPAAIAFGWSQIGGL